MTPQHDVERLIDGFDRTMSAIDGLFSKFDMMFEELERRLIGSLEPQAELVRWRRGRTASRAERVSELRRELVAILREELTDSFE